MSRRNQTNAQVHYQNNTVISRATLDYMKESNVAYQREQGNVYSVTMEEHTATTNNQTQFVLYNPIGSGKTIYMYELGVSKEVSENTTLSVVMDAIQNYSGGAFLPTITNLKLKPATVITPIEVPVGGGDKLLPGGGLLPNQLIPDLLQLPNDGSIAQALKGDAITTSNPRAINKINMTEKGTSSYLNYVESMIEIPSGTGVAIETKSSGNDVKYSINMKYIEK